MESTINLKDFGEKIGGAKKDLWSRRGLYVSDLKELNNREADKYVKKDNVWQKPDYQALIDSGIPVDVVYFIKKVRDGLNAAPHYAPDDSPEQRFNIQKQYIETVREIQLTAETVKTKKDALALLDKCLIEKGYYERSQSGGSYYYLKQTEKGYKNPAISSGLATTMYFRSEIDFQNKISKQAVKDQFGVPTEEKVPRGYEIHFNDGKYVYSKDNDWKTETYYVTRGHSIIGKNFEDRKSAVQWVKKYTVRQKAGKKKRFVPKQLANVRRTGPDYRSGREVTGEDYLAAFGFRGGEFGNWMSQNDRQESLNMGFDALKDLAYALQIDDKDIAYQGALSIAFGARGSGNAAAHYEPLRKVINLTKMHGAGSLAHEWWHGLDDYLGEKMGAEGYLSESPKYNPCFEKLIDTIKYKPETPEQAAQRMEKRDDTTRQSAEKWINSIVLYSLKRTGDEAVLKEYDSLKAAFLSGEEGTVDKLNKLKKSATGHVIPKDRREMLSTYERILRSKGGKTEFVPHKVETDYYRNSKRMDQVCQKDGGYWQSSIEMTARAFATYILDKLPFQSDYLAGHAECALALGVGKDGKPEILIAYPQGAERVAINAVFDELFLDLKKQGYLTDKS